MQALYQLSYAPNGPATLASGDLREHHLDSWEPKREPPGAQIASQMSSKTSAAARRVGVTAGR
jgi:hypothetical protein